MSAEDSPTARLRSLTTRELLRMYAATLTVLIERGVVRTRNAPAGDLAERLVAEAYGGELAPSSAKSFDVLDPAGRKIQVKCRVLDKTGAQVYSVFRSWDFDVCVFVRLDPVTYDVLEAWEVPVGEVKALSSESAWVKGSRVRVRTPFAAVTDCMDVRSRLQEALDELPDRAQGDD